MELITIKIKADTKAIWDRSAVDGLKADLEVTVESVLDKWNVEYDTARCTIEKEA